MHTMTPTYSPPQVWQSTSAMLTDEDEVKGGMWPACLAFWFTCLYVAVYIIRPWEVLLPWLAEVRFERLFVVVLLLVVAIQRGFKVRLDLQTVAILAMIAAYSVCTLNAYNPDQAWGGTSGLYTYLTTLFGFFLFTSAARTKYELTFLVACQLVATGIYLAKSLWEFYIHGAGYRTMGVLRLQGIDLTYSHPNSVAASIVLCFPIWVFLYRTRDSFTALWPPFWKTWFTRGLWAFLPIAFLALMNTNSRSGVVCALLFGALFIRRQSSFGQQMTYLAGLVVVAALVWVAIPEESRERIRSIWDKEAANASTHESTEGRIIGFQQGMEMFRRFPLTGVGLDNFILYRIQCLDGTRLDAHNLLGELLANTGLMGGTAFLGVVVVLVWNAYRLIRAHKLGSGEPTEYFREFGYMARDTVILLLFQGITAHNLLRYNWVWMAAFVAIASRLSTEEQSE